MSEFGVKRTVESSYKEIQFYSKRIEWLATDTNRIASDISEWGSSYIALFRRIKALSDDVAKEGKLLQTYSEVGLEVVRLYFSIEDKLSNLLCDEVVRVSSSSFSNMTRKEVDDYIKWIYGMLSTFLSIFKVSDTTRNLYERYLVKYWQMLYDENGINVLIIPPDQVKQKTTQKQETPQKQETVQKQEIPQKQETVQKQEIPQKQETPQKKESTQEQPPADSKKTINNKESVKNPEPVQDTKTATDRSPNYSNKLFDNKGLYGARQKLPNNDQDIYEVIRMFYPNWSDKKCKELIRRLKPEGCGYAAIANAILYAYEGHADEFENIYGISMYKNGDLNYDELVMYLYTAYDQDTKVGLTPGDQGDIILDMMQMGGHNMEAEYFYETSPFQIPDDLNKGLLTFSTQGAFDITPAGGGKTLHFDEAHAMTVTGVASDGRLIVSTWGGKYYIDPSTCIKPYYTLFKFDIRGNI